MVSVIHGLNQSARTAFGRDGGAKTEVVMETFAAAEVYGWSKKETSRLSSKNPYSTT
jgi:hypothetical protein